MKSRATLGWRNIFWMLGVGVTLLFANVYVVAQESLYGFDPDTRIYVVRPGDTLWDISEQAYEDPWKWPRIWQNNPGVDNPHEIYPDGQLVLPYTDGVVPKPQEPVMDVSDVTAPLAVSVVAAVEPAPEVIATPKVEPKPEPVEEAPATAIDMIKDDVDEANQSRLTAFEDAPATRRQSSNIVLRLGDDGLLVHDQESIDAVILGDSYNRKLYAEGDSVYLSRGEGELEVGQKFYVYEKGEEIEDKESDRVLGTYIRVLGVLQVVELSEETSTARIIKSYDAIEKKHRLAPYQERRNVIVPIYNDEELEGKIVLTKYGTKNVATHQVVYVSLGTADGVQEGTLLDIYRKQGRRKDRASGDDVKLPTLDLGLGVVVDAGENASTVLIVKSPHAMRKGDLVRTVGSQS